MTAIRYEGLASLPAFNPDDDHDPLPPAVADLRQQIAAADAVLFCTPEYAGLLPGSLKNLLEWTVGGVEMNGKPTAAINVAAPGRGDGAQRSLATVLGYVTAAVIEPACQHIPLAPGAARSGEVVTDPGFRSGLRRRPAGDPRRPQRRAAGLNRGGEADRGAGAHPLRPAAGPGPAHR